VDVKEEFDTGDDMGGFLEDEHSPNLLLPDCVVYLSLLWHIAVIGLECFV
jgi:hypothetical protein